MRSNLSVDESRIAEDIDRLAAITEPDRPWTRRAFSPRFLEGRAYLDKRMRAAGLETRIDAAGNLVGRRRGSGRRPGVLMLGSHSDTVPDGGRFDGIAGVVAALETARALADKGIALDHDLEVVDFLAEEVSPFGVSCIGSRGMTGQLPADWLTRVADDRDLAAAIAAMGGDPGRLAVEARTDIAAFLELHIEQGPVLEREKIDIGLVTAIAGITRFEIIVEGRPDHAGTTPMDGRADALVAAAPIVLAVRRLAAAQAAAGDRHFTATVGEFGIEPDAANVIPSRVRLLIDARCERREDMATFAAGLDAALAEIGGGSDIRIRGPVRVSDNPPTPCDRRLLESLDTACTHIGASRRGLASGAGHDAAWIAKVAPSAMIFVPSRGGRSHCPEEWTEIAEIALGAAVLFETVLELDRTI
ncbi:MAG: Zn-dependent hydrolase [Pseudomonadota bacterium]|jgi:N-carbamoyl-L-amino-acid hydrolase